MGIYTWLFGRRITREDVLKAAEAEIAMSDAKKEYEIAKTMALCHHLYSDPRHLAEVFIQHAEISIETARLYEMAAEICSLNGNSHDYLNQMEKRISDLEKRSRL